MKDEHGEEGAPPRHTQGPEENDPAGRDDRGPGLLSARAAMEAAAPTEDESGSGVREIEWGGVAWEVKVRGAGMIGLPARPGGMLLELTFTPADPEKGPERAAHVPFRGLDSLSDSDLVGILRGADPFQEPGLSAPRSKSSPPRSGRDRS